ncbi:MAG: hypothetical protein J7K95_07500 [Thermoplasmata archaeon]|nr:hypothetical protein [Thermoplasmata archaeon]
MKKFLILLLLISLPLSAEYEYTENFYFESFFHTFACMHDDNDAAHFRYYQNDSHIKHWYEWWYFNVKNGSKALLLYFFTFGNLNKPTKSVVGIVTAFFNGNESIVSITSYPFIDYSLDYEKFNITVAGNRAYKTGNKYIINYKARNIEIVAKMESRGIPFGGVPTMLDKWQWMAWYVAMPYGNASVTIETNGGKCKFKGMAYHDHNWGIAKAMQLKWDWGEFCNGNSSIIYGIANDIGGLYFVNESMVRQYNISLSYEKWIFIKGFIKPSLIHIFSQDKKIDLYVEMKKAYVLGIKNFGKPYLLGKMHGSFYGSSITAIGFYEHHGFVITAML